MGALSMKILSSAGVKTAALDGWALAFCFPISTNPAIATIPKTPKIEFMSDFR
jgi:hypothetical protein